MCIRSLLYPPLLCDLATALQLLSNIPTTVLQVRSRSNFSRASWLCRLFSGVSRTGHSRTDPAARRPQAVAVASPEHGTDWFGAVPSGQRVQCLHWVGVRRVLSVVFEDTAHGVVR